MELHNPVELLNELYQHKKQIEDSIADIKNKLIDAPEGSLRIVKKRKKSYYYHITSKNDTEGNYIQRKDEALAISLAQKDYDEKLLTALEQQLSTIDRFLKSYDSDAPQKVYEKLTEARKA